MEKLLKFEILLNKSNVLTIKVKGKRERIILNIGRPHIA